MASLYISKYKGGWRVIQEEWKDNKRTQKTVPREGYSALGIDASWTLEEARKRIREMNYSNSATRTEYQAITRASQKVAKTNHIKSIWLPISDINEFEGYLKVTNMGSPEHFEKRMLMWGTAQKIIVHLNIEPRYYSDYSKAVFNYCIGKQYSPDYTKKLIGLINQWGSYWSKKRNTHFEPVLYPTAREKDKISAAYRLKETNREGGSKRLTPQLLEKIRTKIKPDHYEWLYISLWFGLRPEEIEKAQFTSYKDPSYKIPILRIYQPKIGKWKHIPVLHPEQHRALEWLRPIKRPLNKTLRRLLGDRFTCYAGRKGFEPLMRTLGESKSDISAWLGHTSLRTTELYYEDRDRVVLSRKVS